MTHEEFTPMNFENGSFSISKRVSFRKLNSFKPKTVDSVIEFAFNMTFGAKGEHRHSRSGGSIIRGNLEIFANTFQGKLSEFAVANLLYKHKDFKEPDLSTHGLGVWEDADFSIGANVISVKSTKSYGNLILLESKDWDSEGKYSGSVTEPKTYSHMILVRISPDIEKVLQGLKSNQNLNIAISDVRALLLAEDWGYDIPGYITNADLIYVINKRFVIPKGALLNNSVRMDAENFYVQAGDLRPLREFLSDLDSDDHSYGVSPLA